MYFKTHIFVKFVSFIVSIGAKSLEADNDVSHSIEDLIVKGDQNSFSAVAIMKSQKEAEGNFTKFNESQSNNFDVPIVILQERAQDNADENQNDGNDKEDESSINLLRRKPWKAWAKSAAKTCKKACEVAYKDVCSYNECNRHFKKAMKKQCKRSCKDFFMDG